MTPTFNLEFKGSSSKYRCVDGSSLPSMCGGLFVSGKAYLYVIHAFNLLAGFLLLLIKLR